jgi:hypothetical protein
MTDDAVEGFELPDCQAEPPESRPAILIVGTCRGAAFVPVEILICAETLESEQAVRRWLTEYAIHVAASSAPHLACEVRSRLTPGPFPRPGHDSVPRRS